MSYTLGEAAKATGKSKPTIQRAIKNGRISAKKNDNGTYVIDPAELHRVFDPVTVNSNGNGTMKQSVTSSVTSNDNDMLQREIEVLREQLNREHETVKDLRQRLDETNDERRRVTEQLTGLLTHQQERKTSEPAPGRIRRAWAALTGKA